MKAIAEYFRDLAADDRYFGAEPPTPDTAMLHRIAEREMQRRVETRVQDNGVVLRAADSHADEQPQPDYVAPALMSEPTPTPAKPDTMLKEAADSAPANGIISNSVVEKLSRIRSAMAEGRASGETTRPPVKAEPPVAEPAVAQPKAAVQKEDVAPPTTAARAPEPETEVATQDPPVEAPEVQDNPEAATDTPETATDTPATAESDDDSVLASLNAALAETDAPEDLPAEVASAEEAPLTDASSADFPTADPEEAPTDVTAERTVPTSFGENFATDAGVLDELPSETEALAEESVETLPEVEPEVDALAEPEVVASEEPLVEAEVKAEAEVNPTLQRARARVIKIRRNAENPEGTTAEPETASEPTLSPEAEADLMRELEALREEAETTPEPASDTAEATVIPVRPQRPVSNRRRSSELTGSDDDASVKRLLDQTNSELDGPDNRRRLSAISHLKAAVAATVADRQSGGKTGPTEEMRKNPYRSDLERVVRPRDPNAPAAPAKPAKRPAPLMLVSEQRIDTPRVRPTIEQSQLSSVTATGSHLAASLEIDDPAFDPALESTDARNIFGDVVGFAVYVDRLGAQSLPALLEAAAAYATHVEEHPDVSRLQMVGHVLVLQPELEGDREAILRSFGTLLREGRIEKTRRGRYTLSANSPIYAEARNATRS
ncbi:hypothetical protein EOK75_04735 [Pseudorhodobacter turbinis]|uniref:Uncharacterized protein n=1 Tax=Pseudorhodobacter turbinis TaxID=2500533 RepID=A0A4P8EDS2_9RHOB|nr:hypothetical protein [Pseudorhodobacter turbinis]QCO55140.1 hypothetical protein EOK75_04735 [Pseudorhodobacter turbinis]